jgi:hypothetical protein
MLAASMAMSPTVVAWEGVLVDRTGLGAPGIAAGGLVDFALARTSTSFLLAAVSMVTKEKRAKFEAINAGELWCCWPRQGPSCQGLFPAGQWLWQGLG